MFVVVVLQGYHVVQSRTNPYIYLNSMHVRPRLHGSVCLCTYPASHWLS